MDINLQKNADRFRGFANLYDQARPQCPKHIVEIAKKYIGRNPDFVVDLGCGTGLSTQIWNGVSSHVIGIDPSTDMIAIANEKAKNVKNIRYMKAFANNTGLNPSFESRAFDADFSYRVRIGVK